MNEKISDTISDFLALIKQQEMDRITSSEEMSYADNATQDILHSLELDSPKYNERAKLATKLRDIRKLRRNAKDIHELAEPIAEWAENNKAVIGELQRLLGAIRKIEKHQQCRSYFPRTNILSDPNEDSEEDSVFANCFSA